MTIKRVLWVKACPDYEPLFSILNAMRQDADRRFWIEPLEAQENNCDIEADTGQMSTGVKIALSMSHNMLDKSRGVRTMRILHLKSEIAQRELSDLCRKPSVS